MGIRETLIVGLVVIVIGLYCVARRVRQQRRHSRAFMNVIDRHRRNGWRQHDYKRDRSSPT